MYTGRYMTQNNNNRTTVNKKEIRFTKTEEEFLKRSEICRIATSHNDIPHVIPVNFIYWDGLFYFATDYDTRKYKNLQNNKNISLVIDVYGSSTENKAIEIQGTAEIIERGNEFKKLYDMFYQNFAWVRQDPWREEEAPFIKVKPLHKVSWGI
jgi:nitroimidazol reductase NimA-like FMN-containing flavoprotein (pyridoxamine 5'-phosphate oxidase superfamily)